MKHIFLPRLTRSLNNWNHIGQYTIEKDIFGEISSTWSVLIFMYKYLITGKYSKVLGRLLDMCLSPLLSALSTFKYTKKYSARDGVVDSLQDVLYRDDFLNRNSTMYILAKLLTRF